MLSTGFLRESGRAELPLGPTAQQRSPTDGRKVGGWKLTRALLCPALRSSKCRMANPEHLAVLEQGVKAWNKWRETNLGTLPDLRRAKFTFPEFHSLVLTLDELRNQGDPYGRPTGAHFSGVDLSFADLHFADLLFADLSAADLHFADLGGANLSGAKLSGANLEEAKFGATVIANVDLSEVRGLETVRHHSPSSVGIDTIYKSKGKIPEVFLRGCGVPEELIAYIPSLIGATKPIEFYSAFISYSSKDEEFAQRLHSRLRDDRVRVWFAPEDLKIGDKFHEAIDEAIRVYDKLMVVLSSSSMSSAWVDREVRTALKEEGRRNQTVLFPIRVDDAVMDTTQQWAYDLKQGRHIGDFTKWKDHDAFEKTYARLLRDLSATKPAKD